MIVIAGPAGSGKSTAFPVRATGVDYFNIDDRAAALNGGAYQSIPSEVRTQVIKECEAFIAEPIHQKRSFAVETTLRTEITVEQPRGARASGFSLQMRYVTVEDPETNVERIANRTVPNEAVMPQRPHGFTRATTPA